MTTEDIDSGDIRMLKAKIAYNKKQLHIAEETGNPDKIIKCKSNIEQYENILKKLEQ